jgi:hypothetical protein
MGTGTRIYARSDAAQFDGVFIIACRTGCSVDLEGAPAAGIRDRSDCPVGGGRLRVIADVTQPDVIEKILGHVARQQASPEFRAGANSP